MTHKVCIIVNNLGWYATREGKWTRKLENAVRYPTQKAALIARRSLANLGLKYFPTARVAGITDIKKELAEVQEFLKDK